MLMRGHGGDAWGDFRPTLLGLLGACGAELSILKCATRVMAAGEAWVVVCVVCVCGGGGGGGGAPPSHHPSAHPSTLPAAHPPPADGVRILSGGYRQCMRPLPAGAAAPAAPPRRAPSGGGGAAPRGGGKRVWFA